MLILSIFGISAAHIIPLTQARTHRKYALKLQLRNFSTILQTLHPPNFPTPALTWNSSKHRRQVSSAISMATGKMGSYIVILPIRRFGRLCFSLWIPECNAQIKVNRNKCKCSQSLDKIQFWSQKTILLYAVIFLNCYSCMITVCYL